jgi:hypothetical protein
MESIERIRTWELSRVGRHVGRWCDRGGKVALTSADTSRTALVPWSGSKTEHCSLRRPGLSMFMSVASPQCHPGTVTTSSLPTPMVVVGVGDISLSLMDGEPGVGEHEVEIKTTVVGTVGAAGGWASAVRAEPVAAAALSAVASHFLGSFRYILLPHRAGHI